MKYKNEVCKDIHQTAKGLYDTEIISLKTMQMYDRLCLEKETTIQKNYWIIGIGIFLYILVILIAFGPFVQW